MEIDSLHFRGNEELQHMREVFGTLAIARGHEVLERLQAKLTEDYTIGDENWDLAADLHWRHKEHSLTPDFWRIVASDFPMELSEGIALDGPMRSLDPGKIMSDESILGEANPKFAEAHVVLAPFRFFHRADGVYSYDTSALCEADFAPQECS